MDIFGLGLAIEARGAEQAKKTLNEIDQIGRRIATSFGGNFKIIGAGAEDAANRMGTTFDRNSSSVTASFSKIGRKATGVAAGIASMGEVGASSMQRIVNATSSVAWSFGPQGAIVAAAGVAALAIVSIFTRARKEMVETDRKARELLKSLTLESGAQLQGALFSGDEFGANEAERMGIARARARVAQLQDTIGYVGEGGNVRRVVTKNKEREELIEWLAKAEPLYERVAARVRTLTAARVESVTIGGRLAAEEDARNAATRLGNQERDRQLKLAEDMRFALQEGRYAVEKFNIAELASIETARKLTEARKEQSRTFARSLSPGGPGGYLNPTDAPNTFVLPPGGLSVDVMDEWRASVDEQFANVGQQAGMTFADGISNGFQAAFSGGGLAGGFKALASTVLSGLGGIFIQMGKSLFMYGATMKGLLPFLSNPFTSGFAAMAAGAALVALGGALSGAMSGRGGSGRMGGGSFGGGGYSTRGGEEITKIILMPSNASAGAKREPVQPVVFAPMIIGPDDPQAQRAVKELYDRAVGRVA